MSKKIFLFTTLFFFLSFFIIGGFIINAEENNEEVESEEEIEEEIEKLNENQNRAGMAHEAISRILARIEEDAPQRETLLGVLEKIETIRERTRERIEEALQRKEEARMNRERLEQNNRMMMIKARISDLLALFENDEEKEDARGALRNLFERIESLQNQIKVKLKQ